MVHSLYHAPQNVMSSAAIRSLHLVIGREGQRAEAVSTLPATALTHETPWERSILPRHAIFFDLTHVRWLPSANRPPRRRKKSRPSWTKGGLQLDIIAGTVVPASPRGDQEGVTLASALAQPFQYDHLCAISLAVETCFPF